MSSKWGAAPTAFVSLNIAHGSVTAHWGPLKGAAERSEQAGGPPAPEMDTILLSCHRQSSLEAALVTQDKAKEIEFACFFHVVYGHFWKIPSMLIFQYIKYEFKWLKCRQSFALYLNFRTICVTKFKSYKKN